MIAGLVLSDSEEVESALAFFGEDSVETFSVLETEKIVDEICEREPDVLAVDTGAEVRKDLTENEEELKEEGFMFTPSSMEKKKVKRFQAIQRTVNHRTGTGVEFIRFDPHISSEELAADTEDALESYGVDTSTLDSSREFDALLGAVTARFYQQGDVRDFGIIVPGETGEDDTKKA
ncbi:MAG: hypothetical protein ABEJ98_01085 [Candidatus Nanohaloarchaea archaeon]